MGKLLFFISIFFTVSLFAKNYYIDYKTADKELKKGVELYEAIQFDKAEKIFNSVITNSKNRMDKALALKYLGFLHTLQQDQKKAESFYKRLFDIYPDYKIDYAAVSPKISSFFKDYHDMWLRMPSSKIRIYEIEKKSLKYQDGISLPIEWHDPNVEIGHVIVHYKMKDDQTYSTAKFQDIKTKNYEGFFQITFLNEPKKSFDLNYYIEVFNYDKEKVAVLGSLKNPNSIKINVTGTNVVGKTESKWYTSWWFITAVSVAVVGTIGAVYYNSTLEEKEGVPNDAKLNITIVNH